MELRGENANISHKLPYQNESISQILFIFVTRYTPAFAAVVSFVGQTARRCVLIAPRQLRLLPFGCLTVGTGVPLWTPLQNRAAREASGRRPSADADGTFDC